MRKILLAGVATVLVLAFAAEAQAQLFGRARGGFATSTPYFSYGYGNMYYGSPYYSSGWYGSRPYYGGLYSASNYPYSGGWYSSPYNYPYYGSVYNYPTYGSGWYARPYYGGWYSSGYPAYSGYSFSPDFSGTPGGALASSAGSNRASQSYYSGAGQGNQVLVRVTVPDPNARVWIDDQPTQQQGTERTFISPPLEQGKNYSYTIKASWMEGGREVTREQTVPVQAGRTAVVNFSRDEGGRPGVGRTDEPRDGRFEGRVMRVTNDEVVVTDQNGAERTFRLGADSQILMNGQRAEFNTLRPGMRVFLTPRANEAGVIGRLEASSTAGTDPGRTTDPNRDRPETDRNRPDPNRPGVPPTDPNRTTKPPTNPIRPPSPPQ